MPHPFVAKGEAVQLRYSKRIAAWTLAGALCALGGPAWADDSECDGKAVGRHFDGNVVVKPRKQCMLEGAHVEGNVIVKPRGGLIVKDGTRIEGNVETNHAMFVSLLDSTVDGNVELKRTRGTFKHGYPNYVCGNRIRGNLEMKINWAPFDVGPQVPDEHCRRGNRVEGNVEISRNRTRFGHLKVFHNDIDGDFECYRNRPKPVGAWDDAAGESSHDCEDFDDDFWPYLEHDDFHDDEDSDSDSDSHRSDHEASDSDGRSS